MTDLVAFLYVQLDETLRRVMEHDDAFLSSEDEERIISSVEHRRMLLFPHRECDATCFEVRMLSLRYSDHPDYAEVIRRA